MTKPTKWHVCRWVPDVLALVGPTRIQLLVFFASAFQLFLDVESLSLYSFDFDVLGDVALMNQKPFTRTEEISRVYHCRIKGEGYGHRDVKAIKPPPPSKFC